MCRKRQRIAPVWSTEGYLRNRRRVSVEDEAFPENPALSARGLPELGRRHAGGAVEGADEIGEIAETDVIGDVGDRDIVLGEQARGVPQPRTHQILMRGDAEHGRE